MALDSDGRVDARLPLDQNDNPIPIGDRIQVVKDSMTGASGAGDTFSIAVPTGAIMVSLYVVDSSNDLLRFTVNDAQGSPATAVIPTGLQPLHFGCSSHSTVSGSCATGDLADAATATAIAIFAMGKDV